MKTEEYNFLGLKVNKEVPTTNEEFDKAANELNAACASAVDHYMYHVWGGKFREEFCAAVEKSTEIPWPTDDDAMKTATPKKDGTVTPIHISHGQYFKLVLAKTGKKPEDFAEIANEVAARVAFDPSASSSGGRIAKEYISAAEGVIAKGPDAVAQVVATLNRLNPGVSLGDAPTVDELARAIKSNADRKKAEAAAELGLS